MGAGQALADLVDRKSLVSGLELVGDMPMSLLAYTAWTSPNVWTRTAPCSAILSATPSSLASEVSAKQVWRWSVPPRQHGIAASPRMKAKIAEKKATPKEYLPRTRSIAIDGPALDQWRLEAQPLQTCRAARRPTHDSATITCSTVVPCRCQEFRSPVDQQFPRCRKYPWDRCGMSCRVDSRKVTWPQATEGVESYEHKIQNCLRKLRKTSDVETVRREESEIRRTDSEEKKMCGSNVIDDLRVKLQKRRAQKEESRDAEAPSGSTKSQLATHSTEGACQRALHPVPQIPRPCGFQVARRSLS